MSDKILITGARGQLGRCLSDLLPDALKTDVGELDITDADAVQSYVDSNQVGTIVNCAAYTAVDRAEDDFDTAAKINIQGPRNLAQTGARLIHISTDYVFDGRGYRPYTPQDPTNPLSVYGRTKREGELAVLEHAQTAVIIRTAWLYSAYGHNFVQTMRALGTDRSEINVVADQVGTPTFAGDLARAITDILPRVPAGHRDIYHFTNEGVCSWYDFAVAIMAGSNLSCRVNPIPSSAYPTRATRPFYSVLDKAKIKDTFNISIEHWTKGLARCLKQF